MIFLVYLFIIDKTGDLFYFFLQSYWCLALGSFIEKKSYVKDFDFFKQGEQEENRKM